MHAIPQVFRFCIGLVLCIMGLLVFILPIPLGAIMFCIGTLFIVGSSESMKEKILAKSKRWPRLHGLLDSFFNGCKNC